MRRSWVSWWREGSRPTWLMRQGRTFRFWEVRSLPRTPRCAHAAREEDTDLESLITNIFTQTEASVMADYWRDFLSMTDMLMQNVHAVHVFNWDEYISSKLPWSVAYDNNRYGRWLPDFLAMMTALPVDQVAYLPTDFTRSIQATRTLKWPGTCGVSVPWTRAANWSLTSSPSSRMRSSCWCTPEM